MTDTTTNDNAPVEVTENLDDFSAELFSGSKADPEPEARDEPANSDDLVEDNETEEVEDSSGDVSDPPASEESEDEEETEELESEPEGSDSKPETKPVKKNSAQERITELNAKYREEERRRIALEERLKLLEERQETREDKPSTDDKTVTEKAEASSIDPSATNEDGSPKYPLGEYDPKYLRDTMEQMFAEKEAKEAAKREEETRKAEVEQALTERQNAWQEKVSSKLESMPDFIEKTEQLDQNIGDIDPALGQYIANTLMELEAGPEVLYYLSDNVDEAKAIIAAGPVKATMELTRLNDKLSKPLNEEEAATSSAQKKVSKAPPVPPTNKGLSAARTKGRVDTDDLNEFEQAFFKQT